MLERFYRVQGTQGEGNGLGLAIAEEIARVHHSQLELHAGAGGRGLRVTLLLAGVSAHLAAGRAVRSGSGENPRSRCARINSHTHPCHPCPTPSSSTPEPSAGCREPGGRRARKRPKPGERRVQILQALATMLEQPGAERITTAALAARLEVSEAALYRHFASKAQMFEGLIEFIEQSVFTLVNQITEREARRGQAAGRRKHRRHAGPVRREEPGHDPRDGGRRAGVRERAPAAAHEPVLRQDRVHAQAEPARRRRATARPRRRVDAQVRASMLTAFVVGRLQRFARSGFRRSPSEHLEASLARML